MKKYVINEIYSDGYERFAMIEEPEKDIKFNVHFLVYDEYLKIGEEPRRKKQGDILEGDLSIELVTFSKKMSDNLYHRQGIQKSSHIEAVIEVAQIVDKYSIYAHSSLIEEELLIEFEDVISYTVGDRIFVIGSLELNGID